VTVLRHNTIVFLYSSFEEECNDSVSNLHSTDKLTAVFRVSVGCAEIFFFFRMAPRSLETVLLVLIFILF
jgi:hypothetical protein